MGSYRSRVVRGSLISDLAPGESIRLSLMDKRILLVGAL